MKEIIRTNDVALISFVEALLTEAKIAFFVADAHTSVVEGSIGAPPRRILVDPAAEDIISTNNAGMIMKTVDASLPGMGWEIS